jgi:ornithine cyclodeaminase
VKIVSASDIEERAEARWPELVDAAERALNALASGRCEAPLRTALPLLSGTLLTMPGRVKDSPTALVKLISVVPQNPAAGRPTTQGVAVLFDAETGEPHTLLDGRALTAVRTPAVTAAAVRKLAGAASRVAILGSGMQAEWHARVFDVLFHPTSIRVASRTASHRDRLVGTLRGRLEAEVVAASSVADAVDEADVIVCCTSAPRPLLKIEMLRRRPVTVAAIGAFTREMAEVGSSVFREAGTVFVDDLEASFHEAGDVLQALEDGALQRERVLPIGAAISEQAPLQIFKSVGSAVEDEAVAACLVHAA